MYIGFWFFILFYFFRIHGFATMLGLLYFVFFSLDWVCNLLFRIDVGLFFFSGLALLQFFFFFFCLKVEQIKKKKKLFEGVPNFF